MLTLPSMKKMCQLFGKSTVLSLTGDDVVFPTQALARGVVHDDEYLPTPICS